MNGNTLLTHTCWEGCKEFVSLNLDTLAIDSFETNESLGSKPVINAGDVYLFPSIQNPSMVNPTTKVFKVEGNAINEVMDLGTANITSGSINDTDSVTMLAPYKFDLSDAGLAGDMSIVDLDAKTSKLVPVSLSLETYN
jgi:ankyrin repeat protein